MAAGYLIMLKTTKDKQYLEKAINCLEWLIKNKSPKFETYSWANHFDFASRGGRYTKHESIIVWPSLIGQAFLDAYEITKDEKYLKIALSVCDWITSLPRTHTDTGTCLSYLATAESPIHNSNMLGAAMLARTAKLTGNQNLLQIAKEAMQYSCTRQLANGAWYYGEQDNNHWIDNFHTGYNLDSLKCYIDNTGDKTYEKNLAIGFQFYVEHFFEESGRPKYYHKPCLPGGQPVHFPIHRNARIFYWCGRSRSAAGQKGCKVGH
jgi:rhamnogalacturonyl hydrolase YesR